MSALPTSPKLKEAQESAFKRMHGSFLPNSGEWVQNRDAIDHLRAAQHEATRKATLQEVRTRLVATDPVGLKTGPLFDWLTEETR